MSFNTQSYNKCINLIYILFNLAVAQKSFIFNSFFLPKLDFGLDSFIIYIFNTCWMHFKEKDEILNLIHSFAIASRPAVVSE